MIFDLLVEKVKQTASVVLQSIRSEVEKSIRIYKENIFTFDSVDAECISDDVQTYDRDIETLVIMRCTLDLFYPYLRLKSNIRFYKEIFWLFWQPLYTFLDNDEAGQASARLKSVCNTTASVTYEDICSTLKSGPDLGK